MGIWSKCTQAGKGVVETPHKVWCGYISEVSREMTSIKRQIEWGLSG
jgi:hypothetical protein